jgi:hypothetical protein
LTLSVFLFNIQYKLKINKKMANNLRSMVNVIANEEAIANLDARLDKASDGQVTSFAQAFYDDVEVSEGGGVMNSWSLDNLGSKWTIFSDNWGGGEFVIESASYRPKEFFIHLYKLMVEIDPNVVIEVKYEDEGYSPIGALVIKKDSEGTPCYWEEEEDDIEDPTEDMDWDDEDYDQTQMEFMETIADTQNQLLAECHELIETDGEPIYDLEVDEED